MSLVLSTILAAALGGGVAILVSVVIERLGGTLGGILATLPSTIIPAAYAILSSSSDLDAAAKGLLSAPVGLLLDCVGFLYAWRVLPRLVPATCARPGPRLSIITTGALLWWLALAFCAWLGVRALDDAGVSHLAVGATAMLVAVVAGAAACFRPLPAPKGARRVGPRVLLARGLLAGASIGATNVLAGVGSPVLSGFMATFPAIFITTMVSLWLAQGEATPVGAVGPMMLGSSSVSAFAITCALAAPAVGTGLALAIAWVVAAFGFSLPAYAFLRWRITAAASEAPAGTEEGPAVDEGDARELVHADALATGNEARLEV